MQIQYSYPARDRLKATLLLPKDDSVRDWIHGESPPSSPASGKLAQLACRVKHYTRARRFGRLSSRRARRQLRRNVPRELEQIARNDCDAPRRDGCVRSFAHIAHLRAPEVTRVLRETRGRSKFIAGCDKKKKTRNESPHVQHRARALSLGHSLLLSNTRNTDFSSHGDKSNERR